MGEEIIVDRSFLLKGEGSLELLDGALEVFGYTLSLGDKVMVPRGKIFPFIVLERAKVVVEGGKIIFPEHELFPREWFEVFDVIKKKLGEKRGKPFIVILLGFVDVGKSSFILYASNLLVKEGFKVGIIDADIGQSKIGPPGIISGAIIAEGTLDLSNVQMEYGFFIGDKSPPGHLLQCIVGVRKILDKLAEICDVVLIDTTGLVFGGPGMALKLSKVEILNPDMVIILEKGRECEHFAKVLRGFNFNVFRLPSPRYLVGTSRTDRIFLRDIAFKRFIDRSKIVELELKLDDISLHNTILGSGISFEPSNIFPNYVRWTELSPNGFLVITKRDASSDASELKNVARRFLVSLKSVNMAIRMGLDVEKKLKESPIFSGFERDTIFTLSNILMRRKPDEIPIVILPENYYENLYVGLVDGDGNLLGVGVLKNIDFKSKIIKVKAALRADINANDIKILKVGYLRLNDNWEEIGRRKIGLG
ncbi:MAG: hypothetical protein DRZ80_06395 [Thermoprotei archaeon]|nr:MAG: hypothetical protein DRZ80_06395 [Thermoprotei archaeon]